MMRLRTGLVLAAVACSCPAGRAQSGAPQARFRAGVDVVRLDVSVLDRDRRPVRGLTPEDFVVLEDGEPRPIVAFSAIDVPDVSQPAEGWLRDVSSDIATNQLSVRRIVVILMDDGMTESGPATAKTARQIARAVIDHLGPDDLAAVVFTLGGRSQNFTRDRRQLVAAVDTFVSKSPAAPDRFSTAAHPEGNQAAVGQPPLACSSGGGADCLTRTLKTVAAALEDTPIGRKSIVLISSGVTRSFEAAAELDDFRQTFRSLQLANVNVYPFDPTGLTAAGIVGPRFDSLRMLAENTGGRETLATNVPWEQVPQVFIENSSYYLLGIRRGEGPENGSFRRLAVTVRRPGIEVRTRAGYYAPGGSRGRSDKPPVPVTGLDRAFGAALPSGTLPLNVAVAPFALPGRKRAAVAITIGVRRPVSAQLSVETLEIRAAAFDERYRQRAANRQTVEVILHPNATGERRLELYSRLTLGPGRYEVRVAAEVPGSAGGVFTEVEIPDYAKSPLSVSGLVFGGPRRGASDVLADMVPVLPTAVRVLSPASPVTAFLRVYQGGKDAPRSVEVRARIADAANRRVYEKTSELTAAQFRTDRAADYRLELPLTRLDSGEYLLTIDSMGANVTVRSDVRFTVRRQ